MLLNLLTFVHIFRESVDDASGRCHVEEGHWRVEDPLQHGVVKLRRPGQEPDGQRHGFDDAQNQEDDYTNTINQLKRNVNTILKLIIPSFPQK